MRAHDWAASPLGSPETWPQSLRSIVGLLLGSKFPMFVAWGPDLGFLYNDAYAEILGAKHPSALGARFQEIWAEIWSDILPLIDGALAGEASYHENLPLIVSRRGFEEQAWFTFSYSPVRDESGRVAGMYCAVTETTATVLAERQLRESEARLRLVQTAGGIGSFDYDLQRDDAVCSPEYYAILGLPNGHPINRETWAARIHPDDAATAIESLDRGIRERKPFDYEYRIVRADDGKVRWLSGRATIVFDPDGNPWRYVGGNIDISDRKLAEERLRELNETLESQVAERTVERDRMWANSRDLLLVVGTDGIFRAVNPAWTSLLGWNADELVGHSYLEFIHPDDHPTSQGALKVASQELLPLFENRYRHKDGSYRCISWLASPEGDLIYAYGRDVTSEQKRDAELTAAQDALRQAQKMEAVGQLTGGVAHDFNNLLTIIKSSTDLLRRSDLPAERRRRYVDAISDTVDRASKLTGQLLAFARRQSLKPEVFDAGERIRSVSDMLRTIVGSRIVIRTEVEHECCFVEADAAQFDTALVNMVVNARDAMDGEGSLTIRIDAADLSVIVGHGGRSGALVAVSLTDTGTGIKSEQLPHIFEPFFTTKEVGKGTGLGLSQVYGFAKQSGGDVAVESEVGRGTTFTLYLPRVDPARSEVAEGAAVSTVRREHGRGTRVLVVEDNRNVGEFSTQLLQDLGYETTWAGNAADALAYLNEQQAFDVVFSDVVMPGMNGVELGHEIRRLYPELPILLTSGYSNVLAEEGRHGFELLQKPYAAEELSRVLRRVVRQVGGRQDN
ncbi:PAS domain-containing protein [Salinarimonas soli]|uniref:histidine kinase n=1 Tax=Salinarimonas soli TaxID=1638099 RepID=A0A5B2VBL0_9HYPH|nr:PAS domain-containing protein [Salinarimonas soli]KAA2235567.1 PAS domain-containing protein [Salinarimonas soli]